MEPGKAEKSSSSTQLCLGGCGFYGSADRSGMCSVCFKRKYGSGTPATMAASTATPPKPEPLMLTPAARSVTSEAPSVAAVALSPPRSMAGDSDVIMAANGTPTPARTSSDSMPFSILSSAGAAVIPAGSGEDTPGGKGAPKKNRCNLASCKKKVGLTGFECRCGLTFCGEHRYPDQHTCSFDFKTHDINILGKNNPKVVAAKVEKL